MKISRSMRETGGGGRERRKRELRGRKEKGGKERKMDESRR